MDILGLIIFVGFMVLRAMAETRRKQERTRRPPAKATPAPARPRWPQAPTGPFGGPVGPQPGRPVPPLFPIPLPWEEEMEEELPEEKREAPVTGRRRQPDPVPMEGGYLSAEGVGTQGTGTTAQGERLPGVALGEGEGSEGLGIMEGAPERKLPGPGRPKPVEPQPVPAMLPFTRDEVIWGVVMAEILQPPRSRRSRAVRY